MSEEEYATQLIVAWVESDRGVAEYGRKFISQELVPDSMKWGDEWSPVQLLATFAVLVVDGNDGALHRHLGVTAADFCNMTILDSLRSKLFGLAWERVEIDWHVVAEAVSKRKVAVI